jgi:hypothetical protein
VGEGRWEGHGAGDVVERGGAQRRRPDAEAAVVGPEAEEVLLGRRRAGERPIGDVVQPRLADAVRPEPERVGIVDRVAFYGSREEWIERRMNSDHREWEYPQEG